MKKTKLKFLSACLLFSQFLSAQSNLDKKFDPVDQIKQLTRLPDIEAPELELPTLVSYQKIHLIPEFNIAKKLSEARQLCLLNSSKSILELDGERNSNEVVGLEWKATNNFRGVYFNVERSVNDTTNFEKVNSVWSKEGKNQEKYQLPDNNNHESFSYYRIKQQLTDGSFKYSNIIAIKGFNRFLFKVYPNPALDKVLVNLSSIVDGVADFSLYNSEGKRVQQEFSYLTKGKNQKEININRLPAGLYFFKVLLPDKQIRTGKLIKK